MLRARNVNAPAFFLILADSIQTRYYRGRVERPNRPILRVGNRRTMDLYLIRHADALALGERGNTQDSERPLSDKGYAQSKLLGAWLQRKGIPLDQVFTSLPFRFHQTPAD